MIRLVIAGGLAFVISLGGTTGALVLQARSAAAAPPPASDSGHSAAVDTAHASGGAARRREDAPPEATHLALPAPAGVADSTAPAAAPSAGVAPAHAAAVTPAAAAPGDTVASIPAATATADSSRRESFRQLARIFANMKTGDAAKVLGYMSDDEVQGVVEQLGVRQAAGLLAALPKERAAALSKRLLYTPGKAAQ